MIERLFDFVAFIKKKYIVIYYSYSHIYRFGLNEFIHKNIE